MKTKWNRVTSDTWWET